MLDLQTDCPVCHDIYIEPMVSSCGHTICGICVQTMNLKQCPICRKERIKYTVNYALKSIVEDTVDHDKFLERLEEFDLLSNVEKNVERIRALVATKNLSNQCVIKFNKYDDKITIKILQKIYHFCSNNPQIPINKLTDEFESNDFSVIVFLHGAFKLRPTITKYYFVMALRNLHLIIMSNKKIIF